MTDPERSTMRIPEHLAIIMDGNGRWAQQRRLPRILGHRKGVETVQAVVDECLALGIRHLTLYAFSSENWGRPRDEVEALMRLLSTFLRREVTQMMSRGIRLRAIGELERLPVRVRAVLEDIVERSAHNRDLVLTLALSYGGRNELVRAARSLARAAAAGTLEPDAIDEACLAAVLDTAGLPDPDLMIRTSGETRLSNFLLWQAAYAEFVFLDVLWPDFSATDLRKALVEFSRRERRFGLTAAQLASTGGGDGH
jgi:undecaprenyl diphosphate synthase